MNQEKEYECDSCGEVKDSRKEVRRHVKKCQPQWKAGREHDPLSTRYSSRKKKEVRS